MKRSEWTHCPRGHPLSGDNLVEQVLRVYGARRCKACKDAASRLRIQQRSEERRLARLQRPPKEQRYCPHGHSRADGGRDCKTCARERAAARRRADGVALREKKMLCGAGHDQRLLGMARPNGKGCAECHRRKERARRRAAPEEARQRALAYQKANRARVAAYRSVWNGNARQAERTNVGPGDAAFALILRRDPCSYCGGPAGEVDHIASIAGGGSGDWSNLTAACRSCNARKNAGSALAFMVERLAA